MESIDSETFFKVLFEESSNLLCFDCDVENPKWVSVNNGIFLCLNCAGIHRNFGVSVSFIKSISLDSWKDDELKLVKNGGNANLKSFFNKYDIKIDNPKKYQTKGAVFYRNNLKCLAEGISNPEILDESKAGEIIIDIDAFTQKSDENNKKQDDSYYGYFKNMFGFAVQKTSEVVNKVNEKIVENKDDIYALGNQVVSKSMEIKDKGIQLGNQIYEKGVVLKNELGENTKNLTEKSKEMGNQLLEKGKEIKQIIEDKSNNIIEKSKNIIDKSKERVSQTYECILNNHQKKNDEKEEKKEEVLFKEEIQISEKGIQTGDSLIKDN